MRVGILGSGDVAQTLGAGFLRHGYDVMLGTRDTAKLSAFASANPKAQLGSFSETAAFGEILLLAVLGGAAAEVLRLAGPAIDGKIIIDATNPISGAPQNGVLPYFTTLDRSLMETLQSEFAGARFVKAFNSVGAPRMVNPHFEAGAPTMFIAGDDAQAKQAVTDILTQFGWDTADMGGKEAARAIEPLCILWCIQGFVRGEWTHAFKLLH